MAGCSGTAASTQHRKTAVVGLRQSRLIQYQCSGFKGCPIEVHCYSKNHKEDIGDMQ